MVEKKDKLDLIYPSSEEDLITAFEYSPDILNIYEDSDGLVTIRHSKPESVVENTLAADLKWSKLRGDTPFYPTLRCLTPRNFIEITFSKDGYTVEGYNQKGDPLRKFPNKQERVSEVMDIIRRGMSFIEIFRTIPMNLRADIRKKYINILDCKLNSNPEPTLDCLSLTLRAINMVQKGKIREIVKR